MGIKDFMFGSEMTELSARIRQVVADSDGETPEAEIAEMYEEAINNDPSILKDAIKHLARSKAHGLVSEMCKDVGLDDQGDLFGDKWKLHAISTPNGIVANMQATREHRMMKVDQLHRRREKLEEIIGIEHQRNEQLEIGFEAGAQNCGEALAIKEGMAYANHKEPASSVLATQGQGFGSRQR